MKSNVFGVAAAAALSLCATNAAAQACSAMAVLDDPQGDYSGDLVTLGGAPMGAGLPEQDILGLELAETADGLLSFVLKVQPFAAPLLPPNAVWFTSFETPSGDKFGVRLETDDAGAERMYSYRVAAGGLMDDGPADGRFPEEAGQVPAEAGSGHAADGTITLNVKPESIGLEGSLAGQTLGPFNAATIQGVNAVAVRAAFTIDTMPDSLGRDGFYDFCGGKSGGLFGVGALPLLSLLPLLLAGLRRRGLRGR